MAPFFVDSTFSIRCSEGEGRIYGHKLGLNLDIKPCSCEVGDRIQFPLPSQQYK